jgi:hypothetical protein
MRSVLRCSRHATASGSICTGSRTAAAGMAAPALAEDDDDVDPRLPKMEIERLTPSMVGCAVSAGEAGDAAEEEAAEEGEDEDGEDEEGGCGAARSVSRVSIIDVMGGSKWKKHESVGSSRAEMARRGTVSTRMAMQRA